VPQIYPPPGGIASDLRGTLFSRQERKTQPLRGFWEPPRRPLSAPRLKDSLFNVLCYFLSLDDFHCPLDPFLLFRFFRTFPLLLRLFERKT